MLLRRRCVSLYRHATTNRSRRRELLSQPSEMLLRRTAALIKLQEGDALATLQNSPREAGQYAGRPDFDKRPCARLVELLDNPDPADRLGHLADQALLNVGGAGEC